MRYLIRSGMTGRYALAFIILLVSMTVCLGQTPPATQRDAGAEGTTQATATPPSDTSTPVVPSPQAPPPATSQPVPAPVPPAPATTVQASPAQTSPGTSSSGQAGQPKNSRGSNKGAASNGQGEATAKGVQATAYVIGPDDVLYLNVLHQLDVSSQLTVRPDGYISVRFAGEIKAAGMTTLQLTDIVTEKLRTYFNNPEVNIQVLRINSKKYYVSGQVRKPGAYTLSSPKTFLEAISEAGGPVEFAKSKAILILRGHQKFLFNYNDVSKGKHMEQNLLVQDGDFINVP
jgi:polysaccharide export outer membrane protein